MAKTVEDRKLEEIADARNHTLDDPSTAFLVSEENFSTPEMGDFYLGAIDDVYLAKIQEKALKDINIDNLSEEEKRSKIAAFAADGDMPRDKFGHEDNMYYLKAKVNISQDDIDLGICNGNTLNININDCSGDQKAVEELKNTLQQTFNDYASLERVKRDNTYFTLKIVGLGCPETPMWAMEYNSKTNYNSRTKVLGEITNNPQYLFVNNIYDDSQRIQFKYIADKYRETDTYSIKDMSCETFRWLMSSGDIANKQAKQAANYLKQLIDNANNEIYIFFEDKPLKGNSVNYPNTMGNLVGDRSIMDNLANNLTNTPNNLVYRTGYNRIHQDAFRRYNGVVYIKQDGKFLNLAKLALYDNTNDELYPDDRYDGSTDNKEKLKLNRYDKESIAFADAYFEVLEELDDRKVIQKEIFGKTFEELRKWTVTIGDVTLFVPPTSITCIEQTDFDTMPLLRSKGSATKGGTRIVKSLQLEIYFNEDRGINGYEYKAQLPNGVELGYKLNSLRALVAQFKFTPFLPIDNEYINKTLNIDAVVFEAIQFSNVPKYPKLYQAILRLREFSAITYMPELYVQAVTSNLDHLDEKSIFSNAFNWPVMRWYYQTPIRRGDLLAQSEYEFNSDEYNEIVISNRTSLIPMAFKSNNIEFYLADKDFLDQIVEARMNILNMNRPQIVDFTEEELECMRNLGVLYRAICEAAGTDEFINAITRASQDYNGEENLYYSDNPLNDLAQFASDLIPSLNARDNRYPTKTKGILDDTTYLCHIDKNNSQYSSKDTFREINKAVGILRDHVNAVNKTVDNPFITDISLASYVVEGDDDNFKISYGLCISIGNDYLSNYDNYLDLKYDASNFIGIATDDADYMATGTAESISNTFANIINSFTPLDVKGGDEDDFFNEYKLFIPITAIVPSVGWSGKAGEEAKRTGFILEKDSPDMKFLAFCANADEYAALEKEKAEIYSMANLNQMNNLKYNKYDLGGEARVINFSATLTNRVSQVYTSGNNGSAPQYLGGEDTAFSFTLQTTSKEAASRLCNIPKISTELARRYHHILPTFPLRINSEVTKFLGVMDVLIETARIDTSNDATGVYVVQLDIRSVDRTIRNKEAIERTQLANSGYNRGHARIENRVRTFFEIQNLISKAELYPDLELPELEDMKDIGYDFLRYKFQDDRKYVDPDFYFIYPYTLTSQTLRELTLNGIGNDLGVVKITDKAGASVCLTPASKVGFKTSSPNELAVEQFKQNAEINNIIDRQNAKELKENLKDKIPMAVFGSRESWKICNDITPMFMESKYKKQLKAYETYETNKADSEKNGTNAANVVKPTEGEWLYNELSVAREASAEIEKYLTENPIKTIVLHEDHKMPKDLSSFTEEQKKKLETISSAYEVISLYTQIPSWRDIQTYNSIVKNKVKDFLTDKKIESILKKLNVDCTNNDFINAAQDIVLSAACAKTGEKEYAGKSDQRDWQPNYTFLAKVIGDTQDASDNDLTLDISTGIKKGIEFGCFGIKMYSRNQIESMMGITLGEWSLYDVEKDATPNAANLNYTLFLLDPYYRFNIDRIEYYKKSCMESIEYCTEAFLRNMLLWLKRSIDLHIYPSISNDILRNATVNELDIQDKQTRLGVEKNDIATTTLKDNIDFFRQRLYAIDAGKIWSSAVLAGTDGDSSILSYMERGNYDSLNAYVQSASNPGTNIPIKDTPSLIIRKMALALVGLERIKDMSAIGSAPSTPATTIMRNILEKKYLEAAEDPKQFIPHSFHDMIVNDARGRMLRAFPTFYMVFIDEGREIGQWRLNDNFYNSSAILSMQIVKSRKIPADTANITMSNFYQSYTTDNDLAIREQAESWGDTFEAIFSPTTYGQKVQNLRANAPEEYRLKLRPGARIHIRMGYGASANMLPIVFNGCIAEVTAEDTVEIVAQGDGIELMNPIIDIEEAHQARYDEPTWNMNSLMLNGGTPKEIVNGFLTRRGGYLASKFKDTWAESFFDNCNPHGLYHFGSPDVQLIHQAGEITQNIYEALDKPYWGNFKDDGEFGFAGSDAPKININVFQKTIWDIVNICTSVTPDFICGVAPFGFRSTLFMGAPRYYYAYDYIQHDDGDTLIEKRKPYEQYHCYYDSTDIIGDGIKASSKKMKTVVVGLYEVAGAGNLQRKTDPIMADIDIYPEYQKTMVYDTRLLGKGVPIIGRLTAHLDFFLDNLFDTKGSMVSNEKIAFKMATNALANSMKDMYCGDMVVIGDPSVKPLDRIYINDTYEGYSGTMGVKEVVHNFDVNSGFTTSISPDCIVKQDDKFEPIINRYLSFTGSATATIGLFAMYAGFAYAVRAVPMLNKLVTNLNQSAVMTSLADAGKLITNVGSKVGGFAGGLTQTAINSLQSGTWKSRLANAGLSSAKSAAKLAKGGFDAAKALMSASIVGIPAAIGAASLSYIITENISAIAEEKLKSINAVTVYPIERFNLPYTAGLNGSKGLVVSEHANLDKGDFKKSIASLVASDNPAVRFFQEIFFSDEALAAAESIKQNAGLISKDSKPKASNKLYLQNRLSNKASVMNNNDYRAMLLKPRVSIEKEDISQSKTNQVTSSELSTSIAPYRIVETKNWFANPKLKNFIIISEDSRLKPYIEEQFFFILNEAPTLNKGERVSTQNIIQNGKEKYVKIIQSTENGDTIYNVPLLTKDSLNILYEIVRRTKMNMPGANGSDKKQMAEELRGNYIVLKSALKVGDSKSISSSGYGFILQPTGDKAKIAIAKAIKNFQDEVTDEHKKSGGKTPEYLFLASTENLSNDEIAFSVLPAKDNNGNIS